MSPAATTLNQIRYAQEHIGGDEYKNCEDEGDDKNCVAPSFVKEMVPHLQKVLMADACHLNFGKYTLFPCYGITTNSNASPVVFAIVFGNESTSTWKQFWKYAVELHPYIDAGDITIITDQDKGQKNAISEYLKSVGHFHCSYHQRKNIIKMCSGGGGKVPNSALWMYNKLMKCRSIATIEHFKQEHFKNMKNNDIAYLNSLPDESQYPAARCAMSLLIYMYMWSSSGTVEAMNKANKEMRARTAVDLLNACILLIKLECGRFNKMKPHGVVLPSSLLRNCKNMRLRSLTFPQVISFSTRANMMTIGR
jgi:hypothetical protein